VVMTMRREVACALLIDTRGRLLLQRRDDIPGILQPGKVGLFGGHREREETYLQCVVREIYEEISYLIPAGRFKHLTSYNGPDLDGAGGSVRGELFVADEIPSDKLTITEGALLIVEPDRAMTITPELTPFASLVVRAFLNKSAI
jgi:8-oxo-dGTP diphosphatase